MSVSERPRTWPALEFAELAPMVDYLNRLVQVGGKYSLDEPFEVGWGDIVLECTPRGLRTRTYRTAGATFTVHHRLLDGDVVIEADSGTRTIPLTGDPGSPRSVASFYTAFCASAAELGIAPPPSPLICEIPGAPPTFEDDHAARTWDADAARLIWQGFDLVARGLEAWQAPFIGHRPRVGVMWGGFDLSATRFRHQPTKPVADRPPFMQSGELYAYVSVGFCFDTTRGASQEPAAERIGLYGYIWPQPDGLDGRSWGVEGAAWRPDLGLVLLPWPTLRQQPDPHQAVVAFGDAVYDAAVATAGWPADALGPRVDGWHMSRTPPPG